MVKYLGNDELERSAVVANCRMNRERELLGSNGYDVEIGFDPLEFLESIAKIHGEAHWLDLCCGTGRALIQAGEQIRQKQLSVEIVGVDLVGMFLPSESGGCLQLVQASLSSWEPDGQFDLITCVHGLHYIGDKLSLLERTAAWLSYAGRFVADFDSSSVVFEGAMQPSLTVALRDAGFQYDSRKKRLSKRGGSEVRFPFRYLGADDQAGPNYTGQPAVNSYYVDDDE